MPVPLRIVAFVATFVWAVPLDAAEPVDHCQHYRDGFERRLCYAIRPPADAETDWIASGGRWRTYQSRSKIDDSPSVLLTVSHPDVLSCLSGQDQPYLAIHCFENNTSISFDFGGCHMTDNHGLDTITMRIDDEAAFDKRARASSDNSSIGFWTGSQAIPLIKRLIGRDQLTVRAYPFSAPAQTVAFDIRGLAAVIDPLRAACHW